MSGGSSVISEKLTPPLREGASPDIMGSTATWGACASGASGVDGSTTNEVMEVDGPEAPAAVAVTRAAVEAVGAISFSVG